MLQGPVRTDGSYTYGDRATGITNDHCNCLRSPFSLNFMWRYNLQNGMSIKVSYKDGVFQPLENVESATPGKIYTVFSHWSRSSSG